jgi:hypothetical protein
MPQIKQSLRAESFARRLNEPAIIGEEKVWGTHERTTSDDFETEGCDVRNNIDPHSHPRRYPPQKSQSPAPFEETESGAAAIELADCERLAVKPLKSPEQIALRKSGGPQPRQRRSAA